MRSETACPSCSAASRSTIRAGSSAIRTATCSRTRSPTRCSARPVSGTSARCFRPTTNAIARARLARAAHGGVPAHVRAAGYELVNADCVLIGEEPRIAAASRRDARRLADGARRRSRTRSTSGDDHRPARLHRSRRGSRRAGGRATPAGALARPRPRRARPARASRRASSRAPTRVAAPRRRAQRSARAAPGTSPRNGACLRAGSNRRPRDGQRLASGQPAQRGTRARQTRSPRSHQRLRAPVVEREPGPLLDAQHVDVDAEARLRRRRSSRPRRPCSDRRRAAPSGRPASRSRRSPAPHDAG